MFNTQTYVNRRTELRSLLKSGIILFLGNNETPMNYPGNTFHFRQDSTFLYYFGLNYSGMAAVLDAEKGQDILFADDIDIEDIIWMGVQPSVKDLAVKCGITDTRPASGLSELFVCFSLFEKLGPGHITPEVIFQRLC